MSERIFLKKDESNDLEVVDACDPVAAGILERQHLQAWIKPQLEEGRIFGEELFLIAEEFHGFDKSNRRLDLLALDKQGKLVVIELKIVSKGQWADQQSLRYAAFCSTMTMEQVVNIAVSREGHTGDQVSNLICRFLGTTDLPKLTGQPRIIIAGLDLDDQELTSTVLWLRNFGIDISCIQLTPYQLPDNSFVLCPQRIIPLRQAMEYTIAVENKYASWVEADREFNEKRRILQSIADFFNADAFCIDDAEFPYRAASRPIQEYLQIPVGEEKTGVHYEWLIESKAKGFIRVALHFESPNDKCNEERAKAIESLKANIDTDHLKLIVEEWQKREGWWTAEFQLPLGTSIRYEELARQASDTMVHLIKTTWHAVESMFGENN